MSKTRVRVSAPATVANVACGFDVLGLATESPADVVVVNLSKRAGVRIIDIHGDGGKLPRETERNTASVAVRHFLRTLGRNVGIEIELFKNLPPKGGLGSSAASAAGAVVATNELLGRPRKTEELIPSALAGEQVACGDASVHADNIAPAILGGIVFIRNNEPLDIIRLPFSSELRCTLVNPQLEVSTEEARAMLEATVPLAKAIHQWANLGAFVAALYRNDHELLSRALHDDVIEPQRAKLIRGFFDVKQAALDAGALGSSISGSGPTVFALSTSEETAQAAGKGMADAFKRHGVESTIYVSRISDQGVRVLEEN